MASNNCDKRRARALQDVTGLRYTPALLIVRNHRHDEDPNPGAHCDLDRVLAPLAAAELARHRNTRLFPDDKRWRFDTLVEVPFTADGTEVYRALTLQAPPARWRQVGEPVSGLTVYCAHAPVTVANGTTVIADLPVDATFIAVLSNTGDVEALRLDAITDRGQAAA